MPLFLKGGTLYLNSTTYSTRTCKYTRVFRSSKFSNTKCQFGSHQNGAKYQKPIRTSRAFRYNSLTEINRSDVSLSSTRGLPQSCLRLFGPLPQGLTFLWWLLEPPLFNKYRKAVYFLIRSKNKKNRPLVFMKP